MINTHWKPPPSPWYSLIHQMTSRKSAFFTQTDLFTPGAATAHEHSALSGVFCTVFYAWKSQKKWKFNMQKTELFFNKTCWKGNEQSLHSIFCMPGLGRVNQRAWSLISCNEQLVFISGINYSKKWFQLCWGPKTVWFEAKGFCKMSATHCHFIVWSQHFNTFSPFPNPGGGVRFGFYFCFYFNGSFPFSSS